MLNIILDSLQPHFWSSAYTAWGPDNREACVRVVSGRWDHEPDSVNLELKANDPSNNPYLALGGLIAAGLDGIARGLEPGEPALIDPGNYSDAERAARGIERYPTSQAEALDALEKDPVLMEALGPELSAAYLAVKRSEYTALPRPTWILRSSIIFTNDVTRCLRYGSLSWMSL